MALWPSVLLFGSFLVLLWAVQVLCLLKWIFLIFLIHFSFELSVRPFYYVLSIPIFYSIFLFPLLPVVCLSSCILHLLFGSVFFFLFRNDVVSSNCLIRSRDLLSLPFFPILFNLSHQVAFLYLSAVLFCIFYPNMPLRAFTFLAFSIVVAISLHALLL